jgi:hypothetical protein
LEGGWIQYFSSWLLWRESSGPALYGIAIEALISTLSLILTAFFTAYEIFLQNLKIVIYILAFSIAFIYEGAKCF